MLKNTFTKQERLSGELLINELFNSGKSFFLYPFMVFYLPESLGDKTENLLKILITVPKKNYKRAVKRNFIKRRIREAYRVNKNSILADECLLKYSVGVVYVSKTIHPFSFIEKKLLKVFEKLKAAQ